ncbi:flagellar biosynthesis protein FlhB [Marivibrio halodurans]|uniref:Flagellar biosynthetic protein FlhB n=1 Tax=Marivibrio halodurans TaxID=2039722 RepID=A0A8J7S1L0_9PROT|nr:flagellar biosynthesis protein FlhB [Marivibrio halodurans]MBP5857009.1 flagellar biosynthesis protein FlhB [Marivibrio halodurans]
MSEQADESQKTEEPTSKRLRDARQKGQVAVSREINTWLLLFGFGALMAFGGPAIMSDIRLELTPFIAQAHMIDTSPGGIGHVLSGLLLDISLVMAIPMGLFVVLALAGSVGQNGLLFTSEPMKPKASKVSLLKGLQRMFSAKQMVEFAKGLLKIGIVGAVGLVLLLPERDRLDILPQLPIPELLDEILALMLRLLAAVLAIMLAIAIADVFFQRYQHRKQLRMTKQEVKEEYKNTEGDPQIKARLRQIRNERARQRMMQAVPRADVVVTNPTHFAVALSYKPEEMEAPVLIAKGQDVLAQRIRQVATENDIPVVENPPLARALYAGVEIDESVPPEHYEAVAKVISYVFNLKGRSMPS